MSNDQTNDAQTITLSGNKFIVAGRLPGYTKSTASDHIDTHGGTLVRSMSGVGDETIALVGMNPSYKLMDKILARGLTVVEGDELKTLLEDGEVTLEEEEGESLDALIGKARSLLGETPSSQTWEGLTELVDRCSEEHLEAFIAYLEPQISRWPVGKRGIDLSFAYYGGGSGELRIAPKTWLASILAGDKSPKFKLVYGVELARLALKDSTAIKLFETDQLPNWRAFDIGSGSSANRRGKGFFVAMQNAKNIANIESLTVRNLEGYAEELCKVATMPKLTQLVTSNAPKEIFENVWASNIEKLQLNMRDFRHFWKWSSTYTSLRELQIEISTHYYGNIEPESCFSANPVWEKIETVRLILGESHATRVLCQRLGEAGAIKTLDLSACVLDIQGDAGVDLLDELLVQTGMVDSLERIVASDRFDVATVTKLEELGLEVVGPDGQPFEATMASGEEQWSPHELAEGEEQRRAQGLLDITDALLFEEPSWEAWGVLVGVADGLREQLPPEEFDEAMRSLADAIELWPATIRRLPLTWSGLLDKPEFDARLNLVKMLDLDKVAIDDQARAKASMIQHITQSPHISTFDYLSLNARCAQKGILDAYSELIDAMQPTHVTHGSYYKGKDKEKVTELLKSKGIEAFQPTWDHARPIKAESLAEEMAQRVHLEITLMSTEDLITLVSTKDLDHVVSLKLYVGQYSNPSEVPFEIPEDLADHVVTPDWKRLRRLEININGMPSDVELAPFERLANVLATWVSKARPVVVIPAINATAADVIFLHEIVDAGVYKRAYGGTIDVYFVEAPERWQAMLGNENSRAYMVRFMGSGWMRRHFRGGEYIEDLRALAEAMHPNLRASLQVLKAPLALENLETLDEIMELFPQLELLCSRIDFFPKDRETLLQTLATSPDTRKLSAFIPVIGSGYGNTTKSLNKKEQTILKKGDGLIPERFMMVSNTILSNYL